MNTFSNAQQLFRVRPKVTGKPKVRDVWGISVCDLQEESNPVDDETDEDEDNNNKESSKDPSNADAFSALETATEWYKQPERCLTQQLLLKRNRDLAAKRRRCTMILRKMSDYFPQ
ncbi:uncharacterized protein TNCV_3392461 [Trichonephila clavipes]|nr:uncharacterized protein TNCV_3392461 [Trichonephila clavipes]